MSKALVWREVDEMGCTHSKDMVVSDACFDLFEESDIYVIDDAVDALLSNIEEHEEAYQEFEGKFEDIFSKSVGCSIGEETELVKTLGRLSAGMAYHDSARRGLLCDLDSILEVSGYYGYDPDEIREGLGLDK